jgi:hypothetical protein
MFAAANPTCAQSYGWRGGKSMFSWRQGDRDRRTRPASRESVCLNGPQIQRNKGLLSFMSLRGDDGGWLARARPDEAGATSELLPHGPAATWLVPGSAHHETSHVASPIGPLQLLICPPAIQEPWRPSLSRAPRHLSPRQSQPTAAGLFKMKETLCCRGRLGQSSFCWLQ